MKKLSKTISMLMCLLVCAFMLANTAFAAGVMTGTVTGATVNYRQTASQSGKKLGALAKGTSIIVYGKTGDWYKISINGKTAYMSARYVTVKTTASANLGAGIVSGSVVNMRKGPSTSAACVAKLHKNTVLKIVGTSGGWYKVAYNSYTGYIHSDYVSPTAATLTKAASSYTVSAAAPNAAEIQKVLNIADSLVGIPYVWGGTTTSGFDCSGFIYYVFRKAGYSDMPRTKQYNYGPHISRSNLVPGDMVFFNGTGSSLFHVGIYVGNHMFIHAPSPGKSVCYTTMASGYYYTNFRYGVRVIK